MLGEAKFLEGEQRLDVRRVGVVAQQVARVVGVGADDGDRGERPGQRQQVALVLEQHERLARDLAGGGALLHGVEDLQHRLRVDVGLLEEAEGKLGGQHAPHRAVDERHGNFAGLDRRHQICAVGVDAGQFHVHARPQRQVCGVRLVARQAVVGLQLVDGHVVGDDQPVEAPLVAQDARHQFVRAAARLAVHLVVGRHDRRQLRRAYGHLEGRQVDLAQLARHDARRRPVQPAVRRAIADEVLARRHDAIGPILALQPADVGRAHDGGEIGVLAKGLLGAPPARVAGNVEYGRQAVMHANRTHLFADDPRHRLDQLRLPRAGDADDLREVGGAVGQKAAATLVVDQRGDAQPRLFDQVLLDNVGQPRRLHRAETAATGQACHLAQAVAHARLRPCPVQPLLVDDLVDPQAAQLGDLFFQRHPAQQVVDARFNRQARIEIRTLLALRRLHIRDPLNW